MSAVLAVGSRCPEVAELHIQLHAIGYRVAPRNSEWFDEITRELVADYQRGAGLEVDGRVGERTSAALLADVRARGCPPLSAFRGRLGFVLAWEGHAGRPYWPRGASGVTLDPGFDLRFHEMAELRELYGDVLRAEDFDALELAIGVGPGLARELVHDPLISRVRVGRLDAARILPRIAGSYWALACAAVPALLRADAPPGAHTALLSLTYNAGADDLAPLADPAESGNWRRVAALLGGMHPSSESLSRRRRAESALILR